MSSMILRRDGGVLSGPKCFQFSFNFNQAHCGFNVAPPPERQGGFPNPRLTAKLQLLFPEANSNLNPNEVDP